GKLAGFCGYASEALKYELALSLRAIKSRTARLKLGRQGIKTGQHRAAVLSYLGHAGMRPRSGTMRPPTEAASGGLFLAAEIGVQLVGKFGGAREPTPSASDRPYTLWPGLECLGLSRTDHVRFCTPHQRVPIARKGVQILGAYRAPSAAIRREHDWSLSHRRLGAGPRPVMNTNLNSDPFVPQIRTL